MGPGRSAPGADVAIRIGVWARSDNRAGTPTGSGLGPGGRQELAAKLRHRVHAGLLRGLAHHRAGEGLGGGLLAPFGAVAVKELHVADGQVAPLLGENAPDILFGGVAAAIRVTLAVNRIVGGPAGGI